VEQGPWRIVVQMPDLNELARQYEGREGIVFLTFAWDAEEELRRFSSSQKNPARSSCFGFRAQI